MRPPSLACAGARSRSFTSEATAASTSSMVEDQPKLTRRAQAASSSSTPIAASTWLTARPCRTSRSNRNSSSRHPDPAPISAVSALRPGMAKPEVLHSRAASSPKITAVGHRLLQRGLKMIAQMRDAGALAFAIGQGMRRRAEAGDAGQIFRARAQALLLAAARQLRRQRRAFAHDQRAGRPAGRRSCAPTASCNRKARNPARSCRPPAPHPPAAARRLRAPASTLRRWAGSRRSHCWRPSPPPGRGPCLRAAPRAALPDRARRRPSPAGADSRSQGKRSASRSAVASTD